MQYTEVQNIAKKTIEFIKDNIQPGMTLLEVRHLCETKMMELELILFGIGMWGLLFLLGMKPHYPFQGKNILQVKELLQKMTLLQST